MAARCRCDVTLQSWIAVVHVVPAGGTFACDEQYVRYTFLRRTIVVFWRMRRIQLQ